MTTTIRVSTETHNLLQTMARSSGVSMQQVLEQALEHYRRQRILREANEAYAALHADAGAGTEFEGERAAWDAVLGDGLTEE